MKLHILTIVLDGMPFLPMQLNTFNRLGGIDWTWYVVEGAAAPTGSTEWCRHQAPRLSKDGSTQFLINAAKSNPRIKLFQRQWWPHGKDQMVNHALGQMTEPGLLFQVDVDEIWDSWQIAGILGSFEINEGLHWARFKMNYFVGPNIVTCVDNAYGNKSGEWLRAWRFKPGMHFKRHEPPILSGVPTNDMTCGLWRYDTERLGYVPHHLAYVFQSQVEYKERFYGYSNAVRHWLRLQNHPGPWPVKLKDFLPWVDDKAQADLFIKQP